MIVSDMQRNALLSLDPVRSKLVGEATPMPKAPAGMATGPGWVAVALLGRPYLEILRYPGLDEVRRIQVGHGCTDVALDPGGAVLAIACPEGGEVLLAPVEGGEARRVAVGGQPYGVAWHGQRVFVTNMSRGSLQWIDSATGRLEGEVALGLGPRGLAVSEGQVLVALYDDNALAVVSADQPAKARRIALAGGPCDIMPTGGGALVSLSEDGALAAVDLATGQAVQIPVGAGAAGMARSPDGQFVYVCCEVAGDVAVVALHDNQVQGRIALPPGARPREAVFVAP